MCLEKHGPPSFIYLDDCTLIRVLCQWETCMFNFRQQGHVKRGIISDVIYCH